MDDGTAQYKSLMSEIIAKQAIILGPDIAVLKARNVPDLEIADDGKVISFKGNPRDVLEKLIDGYVELSGQIVKSTLAPIFEKYSHLNKEST